MKNTMNTTIARARLDAELKKQALKTARQQKAAADSAMLEARRDGFDDAVEMLKTEGEISLKSLHEQTGLSYSDMSYHLRYGNMLDFENKRHIKTRRKPCTRRLMVLDDNDQPTGQIVEQTRRRTFVRWE